MDSTYIKIAATNTVTTSSAFEIFGEAKLIAFPLADNEYVVLLEEEPGGTYITAINKDGLSIQATKRQPSVIFVGYGNYKLYKTPTADAVAAAVIQ